MNAESQQARDVLLRGGIVVFPTDTVCGIGCRIDNQQAIDRLLSLKQRPRGKPMPVLVSSLDMARQYFTNVCQVVETFMRQYWPGALTIVYFADVERVCTSIRGKGNTIGIRMPNHQQMLDIIDSLNVPIIGSSANISQKQAVRDTSDVDPTIRAGVDYVLPGRCTVGTSSTVVDCTKEPPMVVRLGAIHL